MTKLFAVLLQRSPVFLILIAVIVGYLCSYALGHQGRLQTLGYLASIGLMAWVLRPVAGGAVARVAGSGRALGARPACRLWSHNVQDVGVLVG